MRRVRWVVRWHRRSNRTTRLLVRVVQDEGDAGFHRRYSCDLMGRVARQPQDVTCGVPDRAQRATKKGGTLRVSSYKVQHFRLLCRRCEG